jgi:hypothetical protein
MFHTAGLYFPLAASGRRASGRLVKVSRMMGSPRPAAWMWEIAEGDLSRFRCRVGRRILEERAQRSNRFALAYPMVSYVIRRLRPARLGSP